MTNMLNILPAQRRPSLSAVLWHVSWPFFVFSAVLAVLLALSWSLLLPRYTRIEVGGSLRTADDIRLYQQRLTAQIEEKEEGRRQLVLAVHDPQYDELKEQRRSRVPLDDLRAALSELAKKITGKDDAVSWSAFQYDPEGKTLVITGDMHNVGTSSMTMLAQFSQSLKDLPFVASATTPAFTREEDPKTGFHSPFTITLTLK